MSVIGRWVVWDARTRKNAIVTEIGEVVGAATEGGDGWLLLIQTPDGLLQTERSGYVRVVTDQRVRGRLLKNYARRQRRSR